MKFAIGLVISFVVGAGCRYFDIPAGSPSVLPGALLVLAMTAGYSWTNQILNLRNAVPTTSRLNADPGQTTVLSSDVLSE